MNYSKNLSKKAIAGRVIASWAIVAVVFALVGGVSGYALKAHMTAKGGEKENEQVSEENLVYGAYDDCVITSEISLDWAAGDLDFTPLECAMPDEEQEFLYYLCAGYNIDFALVMALIQQESNFDPDVISETNDYGYMQINEINHEWITETLGITDYLDPYQNIRAGCYILRKLFERYQDAEMVLMAYNMGEAAAARLWEKGVYSSAYTEGVFAVQADFNKQLEGE